MLKPIIFYVQSTHYQTAMENKNIYNYDNQVSF